MATFDAFALAAAIGGRTSERLALTIGPLAVGVRDPMAMAMGVASVAALSGARPVPLAIGASSPGVVAARPGRAWGGPAGPPAGRASGPPRHRCVEPGRRGGLARAAVGAHGGPAARDRAGGAAVACGGALRGRLPPAPAAARDVAHRGRVRRARGPRRGRVRRPD